MQLVYLPFDWNKGVIQITGECRGRRGVLPVLPLFTQAAAALAVPAWVWAAATGGHAHSIPATTVRVWIPVWLLGRSVTVAAGRSWCLRHGVGRGGSHFLWGRLSPSKLLCNSDLDMPCGCHGKDSQGEQGGCHSAHHLLPPHTLLSKGLWPGNTGLFQLWQRLLGILCRILWRFFARVFKWTPYGPCSKEVEAPHLWLANSASPGCFLSFIHLPCLDDVWISWEVACKPLVSSTVPGLAHLTSSLSLPPFLLLVHLMRVQYFFGLYSGLWALLMTSSLLHSFEGAYAFTGVAQPQLCGASQPWQ